jgi:hypothetical protein
MNKQQVIQKLIPGALASYERFNIFPSVTIAQAILETGWLKYCRGNNLFGIKWSKGCGNEVQELNTHEWVNGVKKPFICLFRKYKSYENSFIDHAELLAYASRYKPVLLSQSYRDACYNLYICRYCTDPEYPEKLIKIIEQNELYKYDPEPKLHRDTLYNQSNKDTTKEIQNILNKLKIKDKNNNSLILDGIYGELTKSAVKNLQKILDFKTDGLWDSKMRNITNAILNKPLCSIEKPCLKEIVRYIQYRVDANIDGIWGPKTDIMVKIFQEKNTLKVDGWVGENTWDKLLN